jgi:predicted transcriptional regulator
MPHEWTTKERATNAAKTLCQIAQDNEGNAPHEKGERVTADEAINELLEAKGVE